jgi:hypothetical protein
MMVVTGALHRHMAVSSKAKYKGRGILMTQAEMPEDGDDEPQAKPCL